MTSRLEVTNDNSASFPTSAPSSLNGAVTAFVNRLTNHLEHNAPHGKLGIVQRTAHGKVDVDDAIPVFQQGERETNRQMNGIRTFDFITQCQLVENQ